MPGAAGKAFGARVEIIFKDGATLVDETAVANAHRPGAKPFVLADYVRKFQSITDGIITTRKSNRFLEAPQNLAQLGKAELGQLNVALPAGVPRGASPAFFERAIFTPLLIIASTRLRRNYLFASKE